MITNETVKHQAKLLPKFKVGDFTIDFNELDIDSLICEMQEQLGIEYITQLAEKYNVSILSNHYQFLSLLGGFDRRDKYIVSELDRLETEALSKSNSRLKQIEYAKSHTAKQVILKNHQSDNVCIRNDGFNQHQANSAINYVYDQDKPFYCGHLKWDLQQKDTVSTNDIDALWGVESHYNKCILVRDPMSAKKDEYRKCGTTPTEEVLFILQLVQILFEVECIINLFDPKFDFEYKDNWAKTNISCFVVDLLSYFNAIPPATIKVDTSKSEKGLAQAKYQYVKSRLKSANKLLKKLG